MSKIFNIAVVQFAITHLQPETNLQKAEKFIQDAKAQGAHVIVFPEDFMTGSIFGDTRHLDRNNNFRHRFQVLAKQYAIDIVTGSWMEETAEGNFNRSTYIDAQGNVLGVYAKNHLYLSEGHFLKPGTEVPVFETKYGKAAMIICWDIMYPEIFVRMASQGVQIVYCPSYWYNEITGSGQTINPNCEGEQLDALCMARAVENNLAFVYANAAGAMSFANGSTDTLTGHSQITLPIAGPIMRMNHNREEMGVQTVDLSVLVVAQKEYQLRAITV